MDTGKFKSSGRKTETSHRKRNVSRFTKTNLEKNMSSFVTEHIMIDIGREPSFMGTD